MKTCLKYLMMLCVVFSMNSCKDSLIEEVSTVEQTNSEKYVSIEDMNIGNKTFSDYSRSFKQSQEFLRTLPDNISADEKLDLLFSRTHNDPEERAEFVQRFKSNLEEYRSMDVSTVMQTMVDRGIISNLQKNAALNTYYNLTKLDGEGLPFELMRNYIEVRFEKEAAYLPEEEREGLKLLISPLYSYLDAQEDDAPEARGCGWLSFLPCVFVGGVSGIGVAIWEGGDTQAGAEAAESVMDWCCGGDNPPPPDPCAGSNNPCCGVHCIQTHTCMNGECVPDPNWTGCPNTPCPPGEDCVSGDCVPW